MGDWTLSALVLSLFPIGFWLGTGAEPKCARCKSSGLSEPRQDYVCTASHRRSTCWRRGDSFLVGSWCAALLHSSNVTTTLSIFPIVFLCPASCVNALYARQAFVDFRTVETHTTCWRRGHGFLVRSRGVALLRCSSATTTLCIFQPCFYFLQACPRLNGLACACPGVLTVTGCLGS